MLVLVGILVVIGAVIGGYLMEHGHLAVLWQPAELVIIGGAALGTLLIGNPPSVVKQIVAGVVGALKGNRYTKALYLDTLKLIFSLFASARKNGATKLEADIEAPGSSDVFSNFPKIVADHHAIDFLCDTLRMYVSAGTEAFTLDQMMELDVDVHHREAHIPIASLSTVGDALPGLGIVAAVLGIVITMGALGGPPEEIGHKVGAALVGTFLGILLSYGFVAPLAAIMTKNADAESQYLNVIRVGIIAYAKGNAPILCAEFARRAIPHSVRPSFKDMESSCRGGGGS
ncbi:MAG: flagellar motor stator protein MotA [Bryobacterales bacterium]|nr:flagellar motor stator protein MotA [Bryobacterales bacterium]